MHSLAIVLQIPDRLSVDSRYRFEASLLSTTFAHRRWGRWSLRSNGTRCHDFSRTGKQLIWFTLRRGTDVRLPPVKRLEDVFRVQRRTLQICTRPSFRADNMFATEVQRLLSRLSRRNRLDGLSVVSGPPPYHFNVHKAPWTGGFPGLKNHAASFKASDFRPYRVDMGEAPLKNGDRNRAETSGDKTHLTFLHSQPGLSRGYPALISRGYEQEYSLEENKRRVFLVLGACKVSAWRLLASLDFIVTRMNRTNRPVALSEGLSTFWLRLHLREKPSRVPTRGTRAIAAQEIMFRMI